MPPSAISSMLALSVSANGPHTEKVGRRLIERLQYIRLTPRRILDIGCGAGETREPLLFQYPLADWIGLDISERMLRRRRGGADAVRASAAGYVARGRGSLRAMPVNCRLPITVSISYFQT